MDFATDELVTVAEAAVLLRVAPSTIRRWIRQGDVPAYRVGARRVALRRGDLSALVTPAGSTGAVVVAPDGDERPSERRLTPEEQQRALAALERADRHSREILERRGGVPFPPSWEIIAEMRDERDRQLGLLPE